MLANELDFEFFTRGVSIEELSEILINLVQALGYVDGLFLFKLFYYGGQLPDLPVGQL